ncbi:glutathione S-transferase family protein [Permianibacter aggregans]|uniref:GST-like protein n=1 Tax=Permianibacter aggregans TaxID=1510150 RepID=A0A4R6UU05_9GAMM|nr:glutathione binding-like protein [Permianibacter aggregans]QGX40489.1 glutathione S-transferase [Permianibacter aggregans]TDQ49369.1 GST-like protein [Permianibacter aggregans]
MIDLYSAATPNGHKISIALEEMGLPYALHPINLSANEQKQPWFLAINPNGRIPAIVDRDNDNFAVFESGAILIYLAEKTGKLLPREPKARSRALQWLMFQMGGVGPMQGQYHHFKHYAPQRVDYGIRRYHAETARLYGVLNEQLNRSRYLAGNELSIADIATFPWVNLAERAGQDLNQFPALRRWVSELAARPAFVKGLQTPPRNA